MILIHILTENKQQAGEITDTLLRDQLVISAVWLKEAVTYQRGDNGKPVNMNQTLIMAKTKALLFNKIDSLLRQKYPERMPILYSVPILNMDWEQADQLMNETIKV